MDIVHILLTLLCWSIVIGIVYVIATKIVAANPVLAPYAWVVWVIMAIIVLALFIEVVMPALGVGGFGSGGSISHSRY